MDPHKHDVGPAEHDVGPAPARIEHGVERGMAYLPCEFRSTPARRWPMPAPILPPDARGRVRFGFR